MKTRDVLTEVLETMLDLMHEGDVQPAQRIEAGRLAYMVATCPELAGQELPKASEEPGHSQNGAAAKCAQL